MKKMFWRPALSRPAARYLFLIRKIFVVALAIALTTGVFGIQPASIHAQAIQPKVFQQPGTSTVQTRPQSGVPRFDAFVRGPGGTLWHRWWQNGTWHDWENLGVSIDSSPAAGQDPGGPPGVIDVFYRNGSFDMRYVMLAVSANSTRILDRGDLGFPDCNGISGFCSVGAFTSAPAVSTWTGRLDLFVLAGANHELYHRWYDFYNNGGWSDWELLSQADFSGDPAAVSWGAGRIDLFVHGADGDSLAHKFFDGHWHSWEDLGGTMLYSPTAASWAPGRLDVFVVGTDHELWTKVFDNGQWSSGPGWDGWSPLGGYFISSPAASSLGQGHLDVVGLWHDYELYHSWWGGQWSPWTGIGLVGSFFSAPAVVDSWVLS